jgi:hypothetical protein
MPAPAVGGGSGVDLLEGGAGGDLFSGGPGIDLAVDYDAAQGDERDATTP